MPWAEFEPTTAGGLVGCDYHYTTMTTMLTTWLIYLGHQGHNTLLVFFLESRNQCIMKVSLPLNYLYPYVNYQSSGGWQNNPNGKEILLDIKLIFVFIERQMTVILLTSYRTWWY